MEFSVLQRKKANFSIKKIPVFTKLNQLLQVILKIAAKNKKLFNKNVLAYFIFWFSMKKKQKQSENKRLFKIYHEKTGVYTNIYTSEHYSWLSPVTGWGCYAH